MSVMDARTKRELHPRWQQTWFTPETCALIVDHVRNGVPVHFAAQAAGIHPTTMHRWKTRGNDALQAEIDTGEPVSDEDMPFALFALAMLRARGESVAERVAQINDAAANGAWQASAWWLERQEARDFAKTDRTELTGAEGGPIQLAQADIVKQAAEIVKKQSGLLNE